jgi:hypothetical protein
MLHASSGAVHAPPPFRLSRVSVLHGPRKRTSHAGATRWALALDRVEPRLVKGVSFCERWVGLYGMLNR